MRRALAAGGPSWAERERALDLLTTTLQNGDEPRACAETAIGAVPTLQRGRAFVDIVLTGLVCSTHAANAPWVASARDKLESLAREAMSLPAASRDDRFQLYEALIASADGREPHGGGAKLAAQWLAEIEATTPHDDDERTALDVARVRAVTRLGTPERALPALAASERAMPGNYTASARLASVALAARRWGDAIAASRRGLAKTSGAIGRSGLFVTEARALLGKGDSDAARALLGDALATAKTIAHVQTRAAYVDRVQQLLADTAKSSTSSNPTAVLRRDHIYARRLAALPPTASLDELIAALHDPWTRRLSAAEAKAFFDDVSGKETVGVGLPELLSIDLDATGSEPIVITPISQTPAALAGLRPMDRIVAIDAVPTRTMAWNEVMRRLRGAQNTMVTVTIARGADRREVKLRRVRLPARPSVQAARVDGFLHLRIERFVASTPDEVRAAVAAARSLPIIVDVRDNPGGDVDACLAVAGALGGSGAVARVSDNAGTHALTATSPAAALPHVAALLVNEGTASAAEVLASGLAAMRHVPVVGAPTRGKCLVHGGVPSEDGGLVLYTVGRIQRLDSTDLCAAGVAIDRRVESAADDRQWTAAIRLVKQSRAQ